MSGFSMNGETYGVQVRMKLRVQHARRLSGAFYASRSKPLERRLATANRTLVVIHRHTKLEPP